jgi:hypothetical protein
MGDRLDVSKRFFANRPQFPCVNDSLRVSLIDAALLD